MSGWPVFQTLTGKCFCEATVDKSMVPHIYGEPLSHAKGMRLSDHGQSDIRASAYKLKKQAERAAKDIRNRHKSNSSFVKGAPQ
jgi:hypothetical protein